jgi:hypothetical protein
MTTPRDYVDVETAKHARGMRLVLTRGVPGPWSESAKSILWVKKIPYLAVAQEGGGTNDDLVAWIGRPDAPVTVYDDEKPRAGWMEILWQAERIAPEPRLIPDDVELRAAMFGYAHELCGENGLGWSRRLMMIDKMLPRDGDPLRGDGPAERMGKRYGYSREAAAKAPARAVAILTALSKRFRDQRAAGHDYLLGESLTALDIYWAAFAALIEPLPVELCPTPDWIRPFCVCDDETVRSAVDPALLRHRDFVYQRHLELPVRL